MAGNAGVAELSMDGQPIRLEIELDPYGVVTVVRSPGCTADDMHDLCSLVAAGQINVHDLTPYE